MSVDKASANDSAPGLSPPAPFPVLAFGPFQLDVALHQLTRTGASVPLTAKAFDMLLVLIRNRDRVLSKDELMGLVWPKSFVSDDSLAQTISVLRRALGDHSDQPDYIATIPRCGYRFVATVTETLRQPAGVEAAAVPPPPPMPAPAPVAE